MEQNRPKFRLRLNLFDGIVLAVALAAAALLGWLALHPTPSSADMVSDGTVQYTVRLNRWPLGTSSLVRIGDKVVDNTKDQPLGEVVDIQVEPTRMMVVNQAERRQVLAPVEGYEDVLLTIQSPCEVSKNSVELAEKEFILRVNNTVYLRGEGYMGSGPIESMEILEVKG